ncbi:MAG TPA: Uma2 family endonuclease [Longimicrobiaceae bacterium]|jgi:Uma2 family endonuclease|nr:Uma2 family endonuclease [Longimicrobiaceae bacterium]
MSSLAQRRYTPEEYLALERASTDGKHEYVNGHIFAMSGASESHIVIAGNIFGLLRLDVRKRGCAAYANEMRVQVNTTGMYTYPDVVAVCGPAEWADAYVDTLVNPVLIVEVLSDSTEKYDRGEKFAHYRRLESLREYVLVSQTTMRVERFVRDGDHWRFDAVEDPEGTLALESVGCSLAVRDIYQFVSFPADGLTSI